MVTPSQEPTGTSDRSTGELVADLTEQISTLVRQELQLAQQEMRAKVRGVGTGAGMFGAAGLLALYGVGALVVTAIAALSLVLEVWLAALVVTLVLLAASGVAALVGKRKVDEALPPAPEHTIASVKKDIAAVTGEDR